MFGIKSLKLAATILVIGTACLGTAIAQEKTQTAQRTYSEVLLEEKTSDPKAVAIATQLLSADIADLKTYDRREPKIYAVFQSLGPDMPKTAIFAYIYHPAVCGSSGCRTVILNPTGNGKYNIVFDTTLGRIFVNLRAGQAHYDILSIVMPRATDGFGVFFWNDNKKMYAYAGVSRFKK